MSHLSNNESVSGNAEKPPTTGDIQGKFWKVNYHLKTDESFESVFLRLRESMIDKDIFAEYIFGEEYGKSGTTRHIEGGFITRTDRTRRSAIQNMFYFSDCQKSKKKNWGALIAYCSKESNNIIHSDGVKIIKKVDKIPKDILREDQKVLVDLFAQPCPPIWEARGLIYWCWEPKGGWGKSITSLYMIDHMEAFVCAGANKDILFGFRQYVEENGNAPKIVVFDVPRCNQGHVSYQAIESVKNGFFYSGKYEGGMCRFNPPHVIVFANEAPNKGELSEDRWRIIRLDCVGGKLTTMLAKERSSLDSNL